MASVRLAAENLLNEKGGLSFVESPEPNFDDQKSELLKNSYSQHEVFLNCVSSNNWRDLDNEAVREEDVTIDIYLRSKLDEAFYLRSKSENLEPNYLMSSSGAVEGDIFSDDEELFLIQCGAEDLQCLSSSADREVPSV